ncbi:rCG40923 [Rattus norvegicus]|uniref:RCG40923 n=1 Tax=Rattus norvegicus TaxID=10116 RepID=A6KKX8_RAT|nr:rCG40923 [Rattus norvegicus]
MESKAEELMTVPTSCGRDGEPKGRIMDRSTPMRVFTVGLSK